MWQDTSESPPEIKTYDGSSWINSVAESEVRDDVPGKDWELIDTHQGGIAGTTFTISDTYKVVELVFKPAPFVGSFNGDYVRIFVNGNESGYSETFNGFDNSNSSRSYVNLASDYHAEGTVFRMTGEWGYEWRISGVAPSEGDTLNHGENGSVSTPLDSITFPSTQNPKVNLEIWGRK
jgi:hypothetical protein